MSNYLHDVVGLSDTYLSIMGACGALAGTIGHPVILGGDFNMDPSQIVETDLDGRTHGQWIVPGSHACTGTGG
eukprot:3934298-Pyramimonas_sp.AAC.1